MLAYIQGNITHKSPTHVVIESGGLGYFVQISLNTFSKIQQQTFCKLHTYLHVGGSLQGPMSLQLFGFYEETERQIFLQLLDISGVGAATVRMILSSLSPEEIQRAILTENVKLLESIKGIGAKTAKRIILELKDKIGKGSSMISTSIPAGNNVREEALSALVMLGFTRLQAETAVQRVSSAKDNWTSEDLIKQALKAI
jgi:Holliday junction DNA helicase RuvA